MNDKISDEEIVPEAPNSELRSEIKAALNRHSAENGSNTPDHILADYLLACLAAYDAAVLARARWFGRIDEPGRGSVPFAQGGIIHPSVPYFVGENGPS